MARHRSYSIEFKRQVAQEFLGGESFAGLARRHDADRSLVRKRGPLVIAGPVRRPSQEDAG